MSDLNEKINRCIETGEFTKAYELVKNEIEEQSLKKRKAEVDLHQFDDPEWIENNKIMISVYEATIFYTHFHLERVLYYLLKKNTNNYDVFITYLKELSELEDFLYENNDIQEDYWLMKHLPTRISDLLKIEGIDIEKSFSLFQLIKLVKFNKNETSFQYMCQLFLNKLRPNHTYFNIFLSWAEIDMININ
jgi:hypothetical protein